MSNTYRELVSLPLGAADEIFFWCNENIGKCGDCWVWASNAHNILFCFRSAEDATLFTLKWK